MLELTGQSCFFKSRQIITIIILSIKYSILIFPQGFIAAISPFNFTAIGGNLAGTPAIVGNVVLWKPASTAILACYGVHKIFQEAGVPDGNLSYFEINLIFLNVFNFLIIAINLLIIAIGRNGE